jgi:pre-mRNA-splicing factor 38A
MANATDPLAVSLHGTNPQNLLEKILRLRIYQSRFWKESCFGLTAATLIDKAAALDHVGTTFSANAKPTPFICLLLKLLQIQPAQSIILEYVLQDDYKYLRALGAFYLRLTARAPDVFAYLEPLLNDFRKLAVRTLAGWELTHMDEFIDALLVSGTCCGLAMPRLPSRATLEATGALEPRVSALEDLLAGEGAGEGAGTDPDAVCRLMVAERFGIKDRGRPADQSHHFFPKRFARRILAGARHGRIHGHNGDTFPGPVCRHIHSDTPASRPPAPPLPPAPAPPPSRNNTRPH